ncbi:MAG: efflux RND transporter periplasmic adaptor subunit [Acidobacteriota bacterium]
MTLGRKQLIPALVLVLIAAGYTAYRWSGWGARNGSALRVSGNIELTEINLSFKAPGRIVELSVSEGQEVKRGDFIARLDQTELLRRRDSSEAVLASAESRLTQLETAIRYQEAQVEGQIARGQAELRQAEAVLAQLLAGSRPQEVESAQANRDRARAAFVRAQNDWERAQTLYKAEDISTAQFDDFRSRFETAQAQLKQAEEQLGLVREGPRKEDIAAARAQADRARAGLRLAEATRIELGRLREERKTRAAEIRQAKAQLEVAQTQLSDAEIQAPGDGVVLVKAAEAGEVVAAGATVVTIGNLAKPWLRAYINERDLGRLKLGSAASVRTDSFPERIFTGRVSFIASEAEFTPKQIQTTEERIKLVYRIKIDLDNPEGELKSNMPADAEISL